MCGGYEYLDMQASCTTSSFPTAPNVQYCQSVTHRTPSRCSGSWARAASACCTGTSSIPRSRGTRSGPPGRTGPGCSRGRSPLRRTSGGATRPWTAAAAAAPGWARARVRREGPAAEAGTSSFTGKPLAVAAAAAAAVVVVVVAVVTIAAVTTAVAVAVVTNCCCCCCCCSCHYCCC